MRSTVNVAMVPYASLIGTADASAGCGGRCTSPSSPEEPTNLSRTLAVPEATTVTPTVWLRTRQGPDLADLIRQPGTTRAIGEADSIDVLGSTYAAADGDPAFVKGPYLQNVTQRSVTVMWESESTLEGLVVVAGEPAQRGQIRPTLRCDQTERDDRLLARIEDLQIFIEQPNDLDRKHDSAQVG